MDFRKKKKKIEKTIRATGLKIESIMPTTILHNRFDLWYGIIHSFFNIFFYDQFLPIFTTFLTLTALYKSMGKIFKFKMLHSDFRIEICTKFQPGKHIIFYILANFFFHTKCPRNLGRILNPVIYRLESLKCFIVPIRY